MNYDELKQRIDVLEYHQKLMLNLLTNADRELDRMMVFKGLGKEVMEDLISICEKLSKELQEQKAEGFVHFHPLYTKFTLQLHPQLRAADVVQACLKQGLFMPLMKEFQKFSS